MTQLCIFLAFFVLGVLMVPLIEDWIDAAFGDEPDAESEDDYADRLPK